jgi:hypothetical protein
MTRAAKLSAGQLRILRKMNEGHYIAYSTDGDYGWLSGTHVMLDDKDIWALRNRNYISQEHDERQDDYGCDKTPAVSLSRTRGNEPITERK